MKYTAFNIKNYKGIEKLELDLSASGKQKIFTLVGLNESGKTTILEALDFFQGELASGQEHTIIPKSKKGNFNDSVSVTATIELDADDEKSIREVAKKANFKVKEGVFPKTIKVEKRYVFADSSFDSAKSNTFWTLGIIGTEGKKKKEKSITDTETAFNSVVEHIENNLMPPIIYYPNFLKKFPQRIYLEERPGEDAEQGFYREVLQDILDSLGQNLKLDQHVVARIHSKEAQDKESLDAVLNKVAAQITTSVLTKWEKLFASRGKKITFEKGAEMVAEKAYSYLDIKIEQGSDVYFIAEQSLGFTWFFSFLLFTEFRKNRLEDGGEILFLIDEPASNLHSTAQSQLLGTFEQIVSKSKLIYTTHSHHLINSEWLEGAYIVKNEAVDYKGSSLGLDSQKTDISATIYKQFAAEHPDQHTYFKPILDTLEYQPSNLELVPEIVVVEGKNDFYTFKYIHDYILSQESRSKYNLHFYPGNGAGQNDRVIRLYTAWGRKFAVLIDGDKAGRAAKTKYVEEIGVFMDKRCLPLNEIDSKWKDQSTEDLFTETERLKIIKTIYPKETKYTKGHFNEAIQSLIGSRTAIVVNEGTIKKFEKIFAKAREALDVVDHVAQTVEKSGNASQASTV